MSTLRSEGWSVRPSFSPHGPTAPVTLLFDDAGLTQLAGDPAVAWQTPWSEVAHLRLLRRRGGATIVAVIAHVLYQWRRSEPLSRTQLDELSSVLSAHGAREMPRARRNAAFAVAALVTVASFAGYFGGLFTPRSTPLALKALEGVNLDATDVSGTWTSTTLSTSSALSTFMPAPGQVSTFTSTSAPPAQDTAFALSARHFESCAGISNVDDRIYGLAGQTPTYQVSSPIFSSSSFGGIQVQSTAQYYDSTLSVASDVAQMSHGDFGRCFAQSNADLMVGRSSSATPDLTDGVNFVAHTFVKGWVRAGVVPVTLPVIGIAHANLVVFVEAAGHYEVTLAALVVDLAPARATLDDLANSLLLRVTSTSVRSA